MPPLFRRLLLLFHALRYGARLIWLAAPAGHKLHWMIELIGRVHASGGGGERLHGVLPALGPLASRFAQTLAERPELATGTLHDAIDAIDHLEAPLPPDESERALARAFGRPLATLFSAVDLVRVAAEALGGKGGGGRPDMAQAGGPDNGNPQAALDAIRKKLSELTPA
jgi:ubiquinone biosynthesis protein